MMDIYKRGKKTFFCGSVFMNANPFLPFWYVWSILKKSEANIKDFE